METIGINLQRVLNQFKKYISTYSADKLVNDTWSCQGLTKATIEAIRSAKLVKTEVKEVLGLALVLRSRVVNGSKIKVYYASQVIAAALDENITGGRSLLGEVYPSHQDAIEAMKGIKDETIEKYIGLLFD